MAWNYIQKEVVPFTAMVTVECTNVGLNTLFKAASSKGMSYYVFIAYSYMISALLLLPMPFFFCKPSLLHLKQSSSGLPLAISPIFFRLCIQGIVGFLSQITGYNGIEYSSPTLASAMSTLTPAFTFGLAVIFRMEKLALRSTSTQAKIIGAMVSVAGALVVVLYEGPRIGSAQCSTPNTPIQWLPYLGSPQPDWVIGGILLATQYLLCSVWYILQAQILRLLPMELLVSSFYFLCVTIISAPVCFIAERKPNAWRLKPDIALVAIVYAGSLGTGLSTVVHTWGIRLKGPVYIAMFKPLSIAIAAVMGAIFLGEALHLGCVIGGIVISVGFYGVLWGEANEERSIEDQCCSSATFCPSSIHKVVPLLQSSSVDP